MDIRFRDIRDEDSDRMIEIIGACYALYPNCILDVDLEEPELRQPATLFSKAGTTLWVMELDGKMIAHAGLKVDLLGCHAEVMKVYLDPAHHGKGLGRKLCGYVLKQAAELMITDVDLWTDSRFTAAHGLYESFGFERQPETRELDDISNTTEFYYRLKMEPAAHV